ncbi:MAG: glycogen synthase GlgA [Gammaproteobacteria bacterium]
MKKVLFVTSEAHPLIKTGGLADVAGSLPKALSELSQDVRILMPNYQSIKTGEPPVHVCHLRVDNKNVELLETRLPGSKVKVLLVNYPEYFGKPGNPYVDERGHLWGDIAERFTLFSRIAVEIAMNRAHLDWKPDIVHCNDWQTGLIPALLSLEQNRPVRIFTIHNLAYQGLFPATALPVLNLPGQLWNPNGLEFHKMLSFIKGGIIYSDRITTVSPTYAREIQTPELGYGLEGLLQHRRDSLSGIVNGIDIDHWNPETDPSIPRNYSEKTLDGKIDDKTELQRQLSLPVDPKIPVFGLISRLVSQKGIDFVIDCLAEMVKMKVQFVLLGTGEREIETQLLHFAQLYPANIAIRLGYDEKLAHLIEAGADIFMMPSRFEPCGLNQMYSQRYGTIPIVRRTGGLADTVTDAMPDTVADRTATGIVFDSASSGSLLEAVKRALLLYSNKKIWRQMQSAAMRRDFSWRRSAELYLDLYDHV